ncbi:hypothetical protein [Orientia tsutsugamushi]|nr:hypothetical protein [Orientia tsutsugamushi]
MLDTAILYDKYKTDQIKKAILIGSCNGEMSQRELNVASKLFQ